MSHSSRVRHDPHPIGPSEITRYKCRFAPGMAMTVGMTMVLPPSHSLKQWGRLCQNGSWGETPVRWCGTPPLDDFPLRAGASGTNRLCKRMGLFEKLLPDTIPLTEEQFKTFLEQTVLTEHSRRILDGLTAQNAATAPAQGAGTAAQK